MNHDDIKILSMLLQYSQRRMVAVLGQLQAHLGGGASQLNGAIARLERGGLVYMDTPTVRLTLRGFAHAVATSAPRPATVRRLGRRAHPLRSRAA